MRREDEMARNPANETFALTSFLYGGNADYIEELLSLIHI